MMSKMSLDQRGELGFNSVDPACLLTIMKGTYKVFQRSRVDIMIINSKILTVNMEYRKYIRLCILCIPISNNLESCPSFLTANLQTYEYHMGVLGPATRGLSTSRHIDTTRQGLSSVSLNASKLTAS